MKNLFRQMCSFLLVAAMLISLVSGTIPAMEVHATQSGEVQSQANIVEGSNQQNGDINQDGTVDNNDMAILRDVISGDARYAAVCDIDRNGVVESKDITVLQTIIDGIVLTYDTNDLVDKVVNLSFSEGNAADGSYGAVMQSGVVRGASNQGVKAWSVKGLGYPTFTMLFDTPQDLSGYTHLCFDAMFENYETYGWRWISVFVIYGDQNKQEWYGSMNVDQAGQGWETKRMDLSSLKEADLTAVTGLAFQLNYDASYDFYDGVTEHAVYIDNILPVILKENADATEETEKNSDMMASAAFVWSGNDWTGANGLSYSSNSNVTKGPDSLRSWSFSSTADNDSGYCRLQVDLGKVYNFTGKDLVFDMKVVSDNQMSLNSIGILLQDEQWTGLFNETNYREPTINTRGDGWNTVVFDATVLQAHLKEGMSLDAVKMLCFCLPMSVDCNMTIYIDNMRLIDHNFGTDAEDDTSDLLADASVVQSTVDGEVFFYDHDFEGVSFGDKSNKSHKFYGTSSAAGYYDVRFDLGKSYDLTDMNLVFEAMAFDCYYSFIVQLFDSNNVLVSSTYSSCTNKMWSEVQPDLLRGLQPGKSLADVRYLQISPRFLEGSADQNRALYIDNVRLEAIDTYDTVLMDKNVVFIGDSITAAGGYKGWSGELEEHYGINRYNIGVGGTSYAQCDGRTRIYEQLNDIPFAMNVDFFILNGGVNDIWSKVDLGTVSDIDPETATVDDFDITTTAGGMEQMFCYLRTRHPNAYVAFVITYNCLDNTFDSERYANEFVPMAKAVCDKWQVPYLDLVNDEDFNAEFDAMPGVHTYDGVHGNDIGYDLAMRQIAPWMINDVINGSYVPTDTRPFTPEEQEAVSDLLYNASFIDVNGDFGASYLSNDLKSTDFVNGDMSLYSYKVAYDGTNMGGDNWPRFGIGFGTTIVDLRDKKLVVDVYVDGNISFTPSITLKGVLNTGWGYITNEAVSYQLAANQWTTITIDFSDMTVVEGNTLAESHFLYFSTAFGNTQAMAIYLDNARLVDADKEETTEPDSTEPSIPDDLLDAATVSTGTLQSDVTNNSEKSWKIVPDMITWRYYEVTLDQAYDISDHKLVVDVMGVDLTASRLHICALNGNNWTTAEVYDNLVTGSWTTHEFDLSTNTVGVTQANKIQFGIRFDSATGENPALYIDNIRLVKIHEEEETTDPENTTEPPVPADLLDAATVSTGTLQSDVTNNSEKSWKIVPDMITWRYYEVTLDQAYDISDHKLVVDVMGVDLTASRLHVCALNDNNWATAEVYDNLVTGSWTTHEFDLSTNTVGVTQANKIEFGIRFDSATGENPALYIDNIRLVKIHEEEETSDPESTEPGATEDPETLELLYAASCDTGVKQTEVTNNSKESWKVTPTAAGWTYSGFNLDKSYDISNHMLVMDVLPVGMTSFGMYVSHLNADWYSAGTTQYYEIGVWTTVTIDLTTNTGNFKSINQIGFGLNVGADGTDYAVYFDNIRLVEKPENANATEETEKASDIMANATYVWSGSDWSGSAGLNYNTNCSVTNGPNSIRSWSFTSTPDNASGYCRMQISLGGVYDFTGKDLVFDLKVECDEEIATNSIGFLFQNADWEALNNIGNYQELTVVTRGSDWNTVTVDSSILEAYLEDGKTLDSVMLMNLCFSFATNTNMTVYIDNMHLVDHVEGTDEDDAASDLLADATIVSNSADGTNFLYEHDFANISYGENSNKSHKFHAAANASGSLTVKYDLGKSYDVTNMNVVLDVLRFKANNSITVQLFDSNDQLVTSAICGSTGKMWSEIQPDLLRGMQPGMDLTDVRFISFCVSFTEDTSDTNRALYVDNVRFEKIDTYDTLLIDQNVVFIGDSITAAGGYKGWSGELEEHYGINRYNIGVGGASYAHCDVRTQIFDQVSHIPSGVDVDFFILNGGVNDVWSSLNLGSVSSVNAATATVNDFDTTTTAGAMEQMFCYLRTNYPNAKVGFVITYNCLESSFDSKAYAEQFVPLAKAVCDKWDVPYLDLVNNEEFNAEFNVMPGKHTYDGVHGNDIGYDLCMRQIAPWMLNMIRATEGDEQATDLMAYAGYAWSPYSWNAQNGNLFYDPACPDTANLQKSARCWKFSTASSYNDLAKMQILFPTYARMNLQNKALQFDVKFESSDGDPYQRFSIMLQEPVGWSNVLTADIEIVGDGSNGWQTITISNETLKGLLADGKSLEQIGLMFITFNFAVKAGNEQAVYIDNVRTVYEDPADETTEAATDLMADATYVSGTFENMGFGHDERDALNAHGAESLYAIRLYGDNRISATNATAKYEFATPVNMVGKALKLDMNQFNLAVSSWCSVEIRFYNSNNALVTSDLVSFEDKGWKTFEPDILSGLSTGMTEDNLSDIKYIEFAVYFPASNNHKMLFIDNVQVYDVEKYDTILNGLNALYLGDSISEAIGYKGWRGELLEHYGVKNYNVSASGSTLANDGIYSQLEKTPSDVEYDFIMLNGGVNDVWRNISLGEVTAEGTTEFDTTTAIGALEHLFYTLKTTYPDAEICYILNYVCVQSGYPSDTFADEFAPLARAACEKWGVAYLDLVDNAEFNAEFDATGGVHTYDGVHANTEGYNIITKYIVPWLIDIVSAS